MRAASLIAALNTFILALAIMLSGVERAQPHDTLRLMTLNAQFFMTAEDRVASNLDGVSHLIDVEQPDVIAMQETDSNSPTGANQNGMWWLSRRNGLNYYYGPPTAKYTPGVGLLSRWPIESARYVLLPANNSMARGAIDAVVVTPGGPIQVIVAHLQWAEQPGEAALGYREDQRAQAAAILRMVRRDMPSVVMGDFNAGPAYPGPAYEMFSERYVDAWAGDARAPQDASSYTWPSSKPEMRIDLVWLSKGQWSVEQGSARVLGDESLSDHRAVIVDARVMAR